MSLMLQQAPPRHPPQRPLPPRQAPRLPVALLICVALGGGAAGAALVVAADAVRGPAVTTVVQGGAGSPATIDAGAVWAATAPGVVDILARDVSTDSSPDDLFGLPARSTVSGSGFVLDTRGRILTAAHVVQGASSVTVSLQDGRPRRATVLASDDATDLAVLKIDATGLTLHPLKAGRSAALRVGDATAAIGNPFQYSRTITTGIISGLNRSIQAPNGFTVAHVIQTDAALNPGNSGGPLLDAGGRVVGLVDQIVTDGEADQSSGVGFATPIDTIVATLPAMLRQATLRQAGSVGR